MFITLNTDNTVVFLKLSSKNYTPVLNKTVILLKNEFNSK